MIHSGGESSAARRAEELMREGRFSEAAAFAGRALSGGDRSPFLLRAYAEALWAVGKKQEALRAAAVAAGLRPCDPRARLTLAQLYLASGEEPAARREAGKLDQAWADNAAAILAGDVKRFNISAELPGLLRLFREKFEAGGYPEAFALAEHLLNLRAPRGNEIVSALAAPITEQSVLYRAGDLARRIKKLYAAELPKELEVWRGYYLTYLASVPVLRPTRAWDEARRRALAGWKTFRPADARRYGWMFKEIGRKRLFSLPPDYRGARKAFALALASPPPEADAFGRMAETELCLGLEQEAFGWLAKALEACPGQEGELLAWRGELRLFMGDYPGALQDLRSAVSLKAYYARTWLALALLKAGRLAPALTAARRAVDANPNDGEALVVRGEILRLKGELARARQDLLLALKGTFPYRHALWAGLNLILLELEAGNPPGAAAALRLMAVRSRGAGPAEDLCRELAGAFPSPGRLKRAVEEIFLAARGCRRDEAYLFALWLPRRQKAAILV
jgi:tetratricopeptide (TPR) repeat protein